MSYYTKSERSEDNSIIWPGFVDVLASTLMVIIFVVLLFTVAQVYLGDLVVGKNKQILSLEKTIEIQDETIVEQDLSLSDKEIVDVNIPTGIPLAYNISDNNIEKIGYLGDEEAINNLAKEVEMQSKITDKKG